MYDLIERLKDNNLKVTPKRREILNLLSGTGKAYSPEEIRDRLSLKFKKVSYPSVYRNLEEMRELGMLARIVKPDRRLYYALCRAKGKEHHHHIVCTKCGKVGEIMWCGLSNKKIMEGYEVTGHFLQVEGVCPSCRE